MMAIKNTLSVFILLFSLACFGQGESTSEALQIEYGKKYDELSLTEWKKFKRFEKKLKQVESASSENSQQLRSYAKDSIQILGVKLMAIKLLDEKKLLDRDIDENKAYYVAVLNKLKESAIPPSEYLFLEEKMAYINLPVLEKKLARSQWINIGFILLTMGLIVLLWVMQRKKQSDAPVLSKQENTVRNMILQGKTNKEIANELFISLSTVKTHITHIYHKMNVANRQELLQKSTGTST